MRAGYVGHLSGDPICQRVGDSIRELLGELIYEGRSWPGFPSWAPRREDGRWSGVREEDLVPELMGTR
jgi:hypothetical protein